MVVNGGFVEKLERFVESFACQGALLCAAFPSPDHPVTGGSTTVKHSYRRQSTVHPLNRVAASSE